MVALRSARSLIAAEQLALEAFVDGLSMASGMNVCMGVKHLKM